MDRSNNPAIVCMALLSAAPVVVFGADPQMATGQYASEVPQEDVIDDSGGMALATDDNEDSIPVAQEIDFVVGNTFRTSGGYDENLKEVARVDYYGTRYVDCEHYPVEIHTTRQAQITTLVKAGGALIFESRKSDQGIVMRGRSQGIPNDIERALLETFDFDTPVNDLQSKHPVIEPVGMQKIPGMLTWKFQSSRAGDHYRVLYIDSHFGDIVKSTVMSSSGAPVVDVALHDYRVVEGIRVPFAIDYRSPGGTLLASDRLERVQVTRRAHPLARLNEVRGPPARRCTTGPMEQIWQC